MPVEGLVRVDLEVRRREPQAAAEAKPSEAGAAGEEAVPGEKPAAAPPPPAGKAGEGEAGRKGMMRVEIRVVAVLQAASTLTERSRA